MVPASRPDPAAETAVRFACVNCQAPLEGGKLDPHLCGACGFPQPLFESETPFTLLGTRPLFAQDEVALRGRFYELSRALHPDRFAAASTQARLNSVERMSRINEAFRMLRSPKLLREAILELHEVGEQVKTPGGPRASATSAKGAPPIELAEAWFELQDAVLDDPQAAGAKVLDFEKDLQKRAEQDHQKIVEQEKLFDASEGMDRVALLEISRLLREQAYLESMMRDVVRLRERLAGTPTGALA